MTARASCVAPLMIAAALASASAPPARAQDRTQGEVTADVEARRAAGDYQGALEAARELLGLRKQATDTPAYRVDDAADQVRALEAIVALPAAAQDSLRVADGLTHAYRVALSEGRYDDALALTGRQLALRETVLGPRHPDVGVTLVYRVLALQKAGDLPGAEAAARRTVQLMVDLHGREHVGTATALNNLADVLRQRGDYVGADALHREALATQRRILGEGHPFLSVTLNNLGALLMEEGEWSEAEDLFRESAKLEESRRGPDHPNVALALKNLATTLQEQGRYAQAETLLTRARSIYVAEYGARHRRVARIDVDLASLRALQGDVEGARASYESSLALYLELVGEHQDPVADLRNRLGRLALADDPAFARDQHQRALKTYRELYGEQHPRVVATLVDLAAAEHRLGQREAARTHLEAAARAYESARLRASGLRRATLPIPSPYPLLAAIALEQGEGDQAWTDVELARGRVLGELLLATHRDAGGPATAARDELLDRLTRLEGEMAALRAIDADASSAQIDAKHQELLDAEAAWSRFQMAHAGTDVPMQIHADLPQVQATLAPDDAMVGWLDAADDAGPVASFGYVLRAEGAVRWFELAPLPDTDDLQASLRGDDASALGVQLTENDVHLAHEVWLDRMAPLEDALVGVRRLVVVPSGPLLGVPVEALVDDAGEPLLSRFAVQYVPSATTYVFLAAHRTQASRAAALLVGDPPFQAEHLKQMPDAPSTVRGTGLRRLQSLPRLRWTRDEVQRAAAFFPEAQVLLGPQASEPALQALAASDGLSRFGVIHLATHAFADAARPEQSALILAQTDLPDPVSALLAGQPVYDGVITARDVAQSWHLRSQLVTLSACDTGLGRNVAGEGILGLAHAFFQAGSRSLLVSLWEVDDEAAALLMERFYGNWTQRGMSEAVALREAKAWLRNRQDETGYRPYRHPYHWASFVLLGNGD